MSDGSDDMVFVGRTKSDSESAASETSEITNCSEMSMEVIPHANSSNGTETAVEDTSPREREDITQAMEAVSRVKEAIEFHDDDALQQALDKVKERPLIDAGFSEKIEMLQRVKENQNYAEFHEVVDISLALLKEVQARAQQGKTSLHRPMEVLNEVLPVFEKACNVFTEVIGISNAVNKNLTNCDVIRVQIKECLHMDRQDVEEAKQLEKKCEKLLEDAVKCSMNDVRRIEEKMKEEADANILMWFKDTKDETNKRMDYLTSEFQTMKTNCTDDIKLTERALQIENESKENAVEKFKNKDKELYEKIEEDLGDEAELIEQLRMLQEHRKQLEEEKEIRVATQKKADVVHANAEKELQLLFDNLRNLHEKVDTANVVLKKTKDVCNMLFSKAVESKSLKNRDLENVLIQSKSVRHVALIAQAVHCKNLVETNKQTATYLTSRMTKRKKKLQDALTRKLAKEVKEHQEKLRSIATDCDSTKKVHQRNDDKLTDLLRDISELQAELDSAGSNYETLDDAFLRFKRQEEGTDGNSMSYTG